MCELTKHLQFVTSASFRHRAHTDAASQETSNCSFNTKLCGFCLIDVFQILFWHKYMLTIFFKKKQNKNKTSTLNLKSISLSATQQSIQWNALRGLFTLISSHPLLICHQSLTGWHLGISVSVLLRLQLLLFNAVLLWGADSLKETQLHRRRRRKEGTRVGYIW